MRADPRSHRVQALLALTGALLVCLWGALAATGARAERTVGGAPILEYSVSPSDSQAGGHPDVKIHFKVSTKVEAILEGYKGNGTSVKEAVVNFPAGFIGNPHATPQCTTAAVRKSTPARSTPRSATSNRASKSPRTAPATRKRATGWSSKPRSTTLCLRRNRPGLLGFKAILFYYPTYTVLSARTDGDFGLTARVTGISQVFTLRKFDQYPVGRSGLADPRHRPVLLRRLASRAATSRTRRTAPKCRSSSNPTHCAGPLETHLLQRRLRRHPHEATAPWPAMTGCDLLGFDPSLSASPSTKEADTASGVDTALEVPQPESPDAPSDSEIKALERHLPGRVLDQPERRRRQGLLHRRRGEVRHDRRSRMPAVRQGRHPLAAQLRSARSAARARSTSANPSPATATASSSPRTASAPTSSSPGSVRPDPQTGRLMVVFEDLPQSPLTEVRHAFLRLRAGSARDPDALRHLPGRNRTSPPGTTSLPDQQSTQFFEITSGPGGAPCPGAPASLRAGLQAVGQVNGAGAPQPVLDPGHAPRRGSEPRRLDGQDPARLRRDPEGHPVLLRRGPGPGGGPARTRASPSSPRRAARPRARSAPRPPAPAPATTLSTRRARSTWPVRTRARR